MIVFAHSVGKFAHSVVFGVSQLQIHATLLI